jgi:hypothetical protein
MSHKHRVVRFAFVAGLAVAVGTAVIVVTDVSDVAGQAGVNTKFQPAAPAKVVLDKAKLLHKHAVNELESDPEYSGRIAMLIAEWLNVQTFRTDKALVAWAGRQSKLYLAAARAAHNEMKDEAAKQLAVAGKGWAEYDKNAGAWANAKGVVGVHKRVTDELDFIMGYHKEVNAKVEEQVGRNLGVAKVVEELQLLAELGNILVSDRPDAKWQRYAGGLRDTSLHLIKVTESVEFKPALVHVQKNCNDCHGDFRKARKAK